MKMDITPSDDEHDFVWMGHFFCMFPKRHKEDDWKMLYFQDKDLLLYNGDCLTETTSNYDLCVTSPPYALGIEYDKYEDTEKYNLYLDFSKKYLIRLYEKANNTGRLCLNLPLDTTKFGYRSLSSDVLQIG